MATRTINVLLTSFPGLNLPLTLSLPLPASTSISDLRESVNQRLPSPYERLIITTTSNKQLSTCSSAPISDLLSDSEDEFLSLRLSVPICGGKGGFGSQLRAAGGRMSSKRKRHQGESNGSSRNLDGRRLRTVTEAKALAEYMAIKPDMDKKQKKERRERWQKLVDMAEEKEIELRTGNKGRVDGKWMEDKEDTAQRTRDAVLAAMAAGDYKDNMLSTSASSSSRAAAASSMEDIEMGGMWSKDATPPSDVQPNPPARTFFGFDDDDEFMSDDDDKDEGGKDEEEDNVMEEAEKELDPEPALEEPRPVAKGKGSGKAKAKPRPKAKAKAKAKAKG